MDTINIVISLCVIVILLIAFYYYYINKNTYKLYKFSVNKVRGEGNCLNNQITCVQLSELVFFNDKEQIDNTKVIITAKSKDENNLSNPNNKSGKDQGALRAFDNMSDTKWLDFSVPTELIFEFKNPVKATRYTWFTANDVPERDPIDWTVSGSNDNDNWTVLSTVTDYDPTLLRNTQVDFFDLK